jgi:tRNA A37 threonylcarbamoyladenosine synthetase subunit TsaC/SUA5/YrdC
VQVDDVYDWAEVTVARPLLTSLLPGPVTLVFHRAAQLNQVQPALVTLIDYE